jgi:hypothetical protein
MTTCTHPEDRRFAWTFYDAREQGDYVAMGCCVCGAVLLGAGDAQGNPAGPQHRLSPKKRKPRKKKSKQEQVTP